MFRSCAVELTLRRTTFANAGLLRAPVARVPLEHDLRRRRVALQLVRPGARRLRVQVALGLVDLVRVGRVRAAVGLDHLRVDDPERGVGDEHRDRRVRRLRVEDDGVGALRRRRDPGEQEGRVALQVDEAPVGEDDVLRGQRRPVGEAHVAAEGERVGAGVLRDRVARGDARPRVGDVGAAELEQRVVEGTVDDAAGRLVLPLRVGGLEVERLVDHERVAGGRARARGARRDGRDEHGERDESEREGRAAGRGPCAREHLAPSCRGWCLHWRWQGI